MNKDFLFACRVCHCPLLAAPGDRGATVDCPNCSAGQDIPLDPAFGSNPSAYLSDVEILGLAVRDSSNQRQFMLRRVRVRRDAKGEVVRGGVPSILANLPHGAETEVNTLSEQLAQRERELAEWQTCHESVERELKRASGRESALQSKINATSNELAQARTELAKARTEAEASRKANEALNRQLQGILQARQSKPTPVASKVEPAARRKSGDKPRSELAA